MGRSCACYLWEKTAPVVSQPFSSLQRSRAGQALPTWGGSWDWNGFTHINILAFIFNIGVPIVCAVWHINKAEELNFSIHRAWAKQGTQTFSMMNFSFHSALAPQSIRAPTVMRAPVHLELFIWVTRWYGLSIPAKLVLICSRDQMQKGSVSQDKSSLVTSIPDTLTGISQPSAARKYYPSLCIYLPVQTQQWLMCLDSSPLFPSPLMCCWAMRNRLSGKSLHEKW